MQVHSLTNSRLSSTRKALLLPQISSDKWCDFRIDYESGMTLKSIAEKYICDPRTVRRCLLNNKSSSELGSQTAPTKLSAYIDQIHMLFQEYTDQVVVSGNLTGICHISKKITQSLRMSGYKGSERTVRNYLRARYQFTLSCTLNEEP